ncbi:MAG: hypothetical protein EOO01_33290 [Chitinophagaceae bacterium]|nr:MAG: hypothetical protein EOO01_33290 [Chitinophagaceae bacterium]
MMKLQLKPILKKPMKQENNDMKVAQCDLPFPIEYLRKGRLPSSTRMSAAKKELINKLLSGEYYLMEADDRRTQRGFILYHGKQKPERWYKRTSLKHLIVLFKEDKKKRLTLNLSLVRQEHGKSIVKRLYKIFKTKTDGTRNNKTEAGIHL